MAYLFVVARLLFSFPLFVHFRAGPVRLVSLLFHEERPENEACKSGKRPDLEGSSNGHVTDALSPTTLFTFPVLSL